MERKRLHDSSQWNSTRPDLFEISEVDKDLVFHGVIRFYIQDNASGNYATKCIRVSSTSTTQDVTETLLSTFRDNISIEPCPYAMYEICGDKERRMDLNEKPLMLQLDWNKNATQGCFILREQNVMALPENNCLIGKAKFGLLQNFKRTLSKEQKTKKKKESLNGHLLETGDLSNMNLLTSIASNLEQKRDTAINLMNPAKSQSCKLRNKELNSEHENHKTSLQPLTISLGGRTECEKQPNKMAIIESIDQKSHQTFKLQNKSFLGNSGLKWHLPLSIKLKDKKEDAFLLAVVNYTNSSTVHFKLSPAYAFYLASRFVRTQSEQKNKTPKKTEQKVSTFINRIVHLTDSVIQKQRNITVALAFWTANTSEFLNFIRQDRDLTVITLRSQNALAQLVQKTFNYLSERLLHDLESHLPSFFTNAVQQSSQTAETDSVLTSLTRAMGLLRRCRVNPAFTIQLFSQLFHFMGAWLLNRLTMASSDSNLCSRLWGMTLHRRLSHVETWAERQGLELAADCHLSPIIQATNLLIMDSCAINDVQKIHSTCFKLNSLQLRSLMTKYHYAPKQPHIPQDLIENVVKMAEATELTMKEGEVITIEKALELSLPFLLPEEGYTSETIQGIPQGFQEFLEPVCNKGLCTLIPQHISLGSWTVYFQTSDIVPPSRSRFKPEVLKITVKKPVQSGMGISIVSAKGAGQKELGIFIKTVVSGGAADVDGRLAPGDQLLKVNGKSLIGVSQERAADMIMSTGSSVTVEIAKLAAGYYGLEEMFNQLPKATSKDGDDSETAVQRPGDLEDDGSKGLTSCAPSTLLGRRGTHHTVNRVIKKDNQTWFKHRLEYCSNPNLACPLQSSEEMGLSIESVSHGKITTSISTDNLTVVDKSACAHTNSVRDEKYRVSEYMSEPDSSLQKSKLSEPAFWDQDKKQTHSEEHVCSINKGGSLVERQQCLDTWSNQESAGLNTSGPEKTSRDGHWKISTTVHPPPVSQPKRIDVPVSQSTNRLSWHLPALAESINSNLRAYVKVNNPHHISALHSCYLQQPKRSNPEGSPGHKGYNNVKESSLHRAEYSPSPNPWMREAREKLERQQRHRAVDLLEQEVLQLQAKTHHTLEESQRLHRLSLEWQFQKRLQELQQNGDDDEEEEEEEEEDEGSLMQQLESESNKQPKAQEPHNRQNQCESHHHLAQQEEGRADCSKDGMTEGCSATKTQHVPICPRELNHKSLKKVRDPENLTFRERQQLFSLAKYKSNKVP